MTMKPLIGMPADTVKTDLGFRDYAYDNVMQAVIAAGGIPVMLPSNNPELAEDYVTRCDGFAFLGGPDIDPTLFGEEPIREIGATSMKKDQFEVALCQKAFSAGKAIFGICRGAQIIAIALGGTMYQDFPSQFPDARLKHQQEAPLIYPTHHVNIKGDTIAAEILGSHPYVNSNHHQTVKNPGSHLMVSGRADDGAVEMIELQDNDQVVAVQWHPEYLYETMPEENALFEDFVERCQNGRA
ncbi:gamma-glutamyl-gamma-aminobutyrate hydrolase family protein [Secundilactobacillus paracollinoides]|uniref:gamma-glutamyl-gamma-aminobutyrate hydrolase family protein n=1 Tax=Secundilactobacillus paracollinoides TaxID=240427 RepID=UPI0009F38D8B|nr:gamma-glutamyl-gamma-aminobutyrate hydrolase family protein [Secundilactobacillus paracollinoides]